MPQPRCVDDPQRLPRENAPVEAEALQGWALRLEEHERVGAQHIDTAQRHGAETRQKRVVRRGGEVHLAGELKVFERGDEAEEGTEEHVSCVAKDGEVADGAASEEAEPAAKDNAIDAEGERNAAADEVGRQLRLEAA